MNESKFKRVMRWVLAEKYQTEPDEPGLEPDEHLGQWLLPQKRVNVFKSNDEPDTELERALWDALNQHYLRNRPQDLEAIWPELKKLYDMGLYTEFLQPLQAPAYRGLAGLGLESTASILGINPEEISNAPVNKVNVIEGPGIYQPQRGKISSWTQDPSATKKFMMSAGANILIGEPAWASIIFKADPGPENNFMMNVDRMPDHFFTLERFADEEEIIAYGPVKWSKAIWVRQPGTKLKSMTNLSDDPEEFDKAIQRAKNIDLAVDLAKE